MDQISVFDMAKEVTLIKNLKLSEHLHSSLVIKYGKVYERGYINDLDSFGRCSIHWR